MARKDPAALDPQPGDVVVVFDDLMWGGRDRGDNRQCWREATIVRRTRSSGYGEHTATVRFHRDGRVSAGHFVDGMRAQS